MCGDEDTHWTFRFGLGFKFKDIKPIKLIFFWIAVLYHPIAFIIVKHWVFLLWLRYKEDLSIYILLFYVDRHALSMDLHTYVYVYRHYISRS